MFESKCNIHLNRFSPAIMLTMAALAAVILEASFVATAGATMQEVSSWQAEDRSTVGMWFNGGEVKVVSSPQADGGKWLLYKAEARGNFIEFALPDVLPGRYRLEIRFHSHAKRSTCRVELGEADGSGRQIVLGKLDMGGEDGFRTALSDPLSIRRMGFRTVRFVITEARDGATHLSVDRLRLVPEPLNQLAFPADLSASDITSNSCTLTWKAVKDAAGYLVRRRGGKTKQWRVVGLPPAATVEFTAAGLCDNTDYEFSLCAHSPEGRGNWSPPVKVKTPHGDHNRRGSTLARSPGRIGGASMMMRGDGSILLMAHYQDKVQDQGLFEIHQMTSVDNGKTWSKLKALLSAPDRTFMMPALLRLKSGVALFCYTERNKSLTESKRYCKRSTDGGLTWSEPILITKETLKTQGLEFSVPTGPHDRLIQASSGRILIPIHYPWFPPDAKPPRNHARWIASSVYYSDDEGRTWACATGPILLRGMTPAASRNRDIQGVWEPAIVEVEPGKLLMYMRSNTGWYYEIRSNDNGTTWTPPRQSSFRAPLAPAKLVKLPDGVIGIVYNGIVDYNDYNFGRRWELATMTSRDGGATWQNPRLLEFADPYGGQRKLQYCYPSLLWNKGVLHLTYYGVVGGRMFNMLYQRLPADWFSTQGIPPKAQ